MPCTMNRRVALGFRRTLAEVGDPTEKGCSAVPRTDSPAPPEPTPAAATPAARRPLLRWAVRLVPILLLSAAAWVLWREFHELSLGDLHHAMTAWTWPTLAAALLFSVASFFLMGMVEWFGLRWSGATPPFGAAVAVSFVANAVAHSLGANLLVSGALRARLYERYGVNLAQVAATTLFGGVSYAVGLAALSGGGLLLADRHDLTATAIPVQVARMAGVALVAGALAYNLTCALRRAPFKAFGQSLTLPSLRDALAQTAIGVADNGIAAGIIWILLPRDGPDYATFVGAYAISCVTGLLSTVPAGAGVFESALTTLLHSASAAGLAAAFLGYRLLYYLLPLIVASLALAGDIAWRRPKADPAI